MLVIMLMANKNFNKLLILVTGIVQDKYSYVIMRFFCIFRNRNRLVHFISIAIDFIISFVMKLYMTIIVQARNTVRVCMSVCSDVNFYFITRQRFVVGQYSLNVDAVSRLIFLMVGRCDDFYGRFFLVH